jgi:ketosteroid isomerase-like protein
MNEDELLARRFEEHRAHLRAVAYRMLGSAGEADDAVQEAWLRISRTHTSDVDNLAGWLTTVVARVCLNMLRSRDTRREEPWDARQAQPAEGARPTPSIRRCSPIRSGWRCWWCSTRWPRPNGWRSCCTTCSPCRSRRSPRASSGLRPRPGSSPAARRRVRGAQAAPDADGARRREIVAAFLAASRDGDFDALLALLDPDVVLRTDRVAAQTGASDARGAQAVAGTFAGRARAARPALIDGSAGLVWTQGGRVRVVFGFTIADGKITAIDVLADPEHLGRLDLEILPG